NDRCLSGVSVVGRMRIGIEIVLRAEPFGRNPPEGAALGEHVFPKLRRRARLGVHARHADDGNWFGHRLDLFSAAKASCLSHTRIVIHFRRFELTGITYTYTYIDCRTGR